MNPGIVTNKISLFPGSLVPWSPGIITDASLGGWHAIWVTTWSFAPDHPCHRAYLWPRTALELRPQPVEKSARAIEKAGEDP